MAGEKNGAASTLKTEIFLLELDETKLELKDFIELYCIARNTTLFSCFFVSAAYVTKTAFC